MHPVEVTIPLMVYVVVEFGFAWTTDPVEGFKLLEGLQTKVVPGISELTDKGTAASSIHLELGIELKRLGQTAGKS